MSTLSEWGLPKIPKLDEEEITSTPIAKTAPRDLPLGTEDTAAGFIDGRSFDEVATEFSNNLFDICGMGSKRYRSIAICGHWGSGKTSFVHRVVSKYDRRSQVVFFDPWMFSSEQSLVEQFFRQLMDALGDESAPLINDYAQAVIGLVGSGVFDYLIDKEYRGLGSGLAGAFKSITQAGKSGVSNSVEGESLTRAKYQIEQKLMEKKNPIIVVVDNVDRLTPKLMALLFQFIGSVVNLPNILYILLFDREVVTAALEEELKIPKGEGGAFLNKIVYLCINLPKLDLIEPIKQGFRFDREFPIEQCGDVTAYNSLQLQLAETLSYILSDARTILKVSQAYLTNCVLGKRDYLIRTAPMCDTVISELLLKHYDWLRAEGEARVYEFLDIVERTRRHSEASLRGNAQKNEQNNAADSLPESEYSGNKKILESTGPSMVYLSDEVYSDKRDQLNTGVKPSVGPDELLESYIGLFRSMDLDEEGKERLKAKLAPPITEYYERASDLLVLDGMESDVKDAMLTLLALDAACIERKLHLMKNSPSNEVLLQPLKTLIYSV